VFYLPSSALQLGSLVNSYSSLGASWNFQVDDGWGDATFCATGSVFNMYGSTILFRGLSKDASIWESDIKQSIISSDTTGYVGFRSATTSVSGQIYVYGCVFRLYTTLDTVEDIHCHHAPYGIGAGWTGATVTVKNVKFTDTDHGDIFAGGVAGSNVQALNLFSSISSIAINDADSWAKEQYTINIHVTDKDGGAIANTATVACTRANVVTESAKFYKCISAHTSGTFATDLAAGKWEEITDATILAAAPAWLTSTAYVSAEQEFSVNPTSGAIAEQTITYKKWTGTSELETKYIHTFTLSESGYETLVITDIEVDAKIDWYLELQQQKQPPAPWQEGMM